MKSAITGCAVVCFETSFLQGANRAVTIDTRDVGLVDRREDDAQPR